MFLAIEPIDIVIISIVIILVLIVMILVWISFIKPVIKLALIHARERMTKIKYKENYKLIKTDKKHFEIVESNKTFFNEWYVWVSSSQGNGIVLGESEGRHKNFFRMMYFLNSKNSNKPSMYIDDPYFDLDKVSLTDVKVYEITNNGVIYDYQTKKEYRINFLSYLESISKENYSKKYIKLVANQIFDKRYLEEAGFSILSDLEKVFNIIINYIKNSSNIEFSLEGVLEVWNAIPTWSNELNQKRNKLDKTTKTLLSDINKILSIRSDNDLEVYFDKLVRRFLTKSNKTKQLDFDINKLFSRPFLIFKKEIDYDNNMNLVNTLFIKTINFAKEYGHNDSKSRLNRDLLIMINDFDKYRNFVDIDNFLDHSTSKNVYYYLGINTISNYDDSYKKQAYLVESLFEKKYLTTPTSNYKDIYLMDFSRRWIHKEDYVRDETWINEKIVTDRKIRHYNQMSYSFKKNTYVSRQGRTVDKFDNNDVFKHKEQIKWYKYFLNKLR